MDLQEEKMKQPILISVLVGVVMSYGYFCFAVWRVSISIVSSLFSLSIPVLLALPHLPGSIGEINGRPYFSSNTASLSFSVNETSYRGVIDYSSARRLPLEVPVRILSSPGGSSSGMYRLMLNSLIIDGECVSACAWLFILSPDACYTDNMVLHFHSWHRETRRQIVLYTHADDGRQFGLQWTRTVLLTDMTRKYLSLVNEPLRSYLSELPLTSTVISPPVDLVHMSYPNKKCEPADE